MVKNVGIGVVVVRYVGEVWRGKRSELNLGRGCVGVVVVVVVVVVDDDNCCVG